MPARSVHFTVRRLLSIYEACKRFFGPGGTPGSASSDLGGHLQDDDLAPYSVRDNAMIRTLLISSCPWILTATFLQVFVETSTPLASCAVRLMSHYLSMAAGSILN